jgi:hypothetical protein
VEDAYRGSSLLAMFSTSVNKNLLLVYSHSVRIHSLCMYINLYNVFIYIYEYVVKHRCQCISYSSRPDYCFVRKLLTEVKFAVYLVVPVSVVECTVVNVTSSELELWFIVYPNGP